MKTVYTLLFAGWISATNAFAQWPNHPAGQSGIRLELTSGNRYILLINGQQFNLQGNLFMQDGIPAGRHQVQIGYYTGQGWFRQFVPVYSHFVDFRYGQRLYGRINFSGHLVILGYEPLFPVITQCPPVFPQPHWPTCPPVTPPPGSYCPPGQFPRPPFPGQLPVVPGQGWGNIRPMSHQEFAGLLQVIRNRSFDSDQLLIARQAVRNSALSALQIRQIMDLFSFESTKLEFARFAYDYCLDRENYYLIYDAFTFSGSIHTLEQYLARR